MKRIAPTLLTLLAVTGTFCRPSPACAQEVLRWERLPLAIPLIVGQERIILLDRAMRVGVPPDLRERLRVQSVDSALYLRASAPFDSTRLQLEDRDSGALILLDAHATAPLAGQSALEPLRIIDGVREHSTERNVIPAEGTPAEGSENNTPAPVVLIRYAAQSLYAPLRTIEPVAGITRVRLPRTLALESVLPSLPLHVTVLAAWRFQDYWVTALKLSNRGNQGLELDPRALQGDFLAASFQHHTLGPHGDSTDTTVLYLVTRSHGLAQAVLPALSAVEPSLDLPSPRVRP